MSNPTVSPQRLDISGVFNSNRDCSLKFPALVICLAFMSIETIIFPQFLPTLQLERRTHGFFKSLVGNRMRAWALACTLS